MDGAGGTVNVEYTTDEIEEYADGNWTNIGSTTTNVGQTLNSNFASAILAIGRKDITTSNVNGEIDIIRWWGYAGSNSGTATHRWDFYGRDYARGDSVGFTSATGEQWKSIGTVPSAPLLNEKRLTGYGISNDLTVKTFDANTVTVAELADIVATLIKDLGGT
jgi:hypothetical protein